MDLDTEFLAGRDIMDYSLLVGFSEVLPGEKTFEDLYGEEERNAPWWFGYQMDSSGKIRVYRISLGIIDILQTFTVKKRAEFASKTLRYCATNEVRHFALKKEENHDTQETPKFSIFPFPTPPPPFPTFHIAFHSLIVVVIDRNGHGRCDILQRLQAVLKDADLSCFYLSLFLVLLSAYLFGFFGPFCLVHNIAHAVDCALDSLYCLVV